jgi:uncharacterized protein YkwD
MPKNLEKIRIATISAVISLIIASFGVPIIPQHAEATGDQTMTNLTNDQRTKFKLSKLKWSAVLARSAAVKVQDMCQKNYWAHTSTDGQTPWEIISSSGYEYSYAGENLAKGYTSDAQRVAAWMESPEHKANILGKNFKEIGSATISCDFQGKETTITVAHYGSR